MTLLLGAKITSPLDQHFYVLSPSYSFVWHPRVPSGPSMIEQLDTRWKPAGNPLWWVFVKKTKSRIFPALNCPYYLLMMYLGLEIKLIGPLVHGGFPMGLWLLHHWQTTGYAACYLRIFFNQKTNVSRLESHLYELNIKDILSFLNQVKLSKQNLVLSSSLDKSSGKYYPSKFFHWL